jgi:hypothetical protein
MSPETKRKFLEFYRKDKKYGVSKGISVVTGGLFYQVDYEICKSELKSYGKRKMGVIIAVASASAFSGEVILATNAINVTKIANAMHNVFAVAYYIAHNIAESPILVVDCALFGEYISSYEDTDCN